MHELLKKADELTDIGKATEAIKILREIKNTADSSFLRREGAKIAELFGAAFSILGDAEKAAAAYLDAATKDNFLRAQRGHISSYLFILHYLSNVATEDLYEEQAKFKKLFADTKPFKVDKYKHKKLKIGYLLSKTQKSSLSNFIAPLLTEYDKDKFEVCVYAFSEKENNKKIRDSAMSYKILDITSYYDSAKIIKDDEIDILFDLSAYGEGGDSLSILAQRPAPVQIVGIGWPGIVNLPFVDYILADDFLIDDKMQDNPLTVPNALCFKPDDDMLKNRRKPKNANSPIILGVFNNFLKITDEALLLWKDILENLPDARLILQDSSIYEERTDFMENRLKNLNIGERVTVKTASEDYLADLADADVVLDTFPYTGGFMTATAIVLGTPVITLSGERFSSKFSADILKIAGLGKFIAYNKEEYKNSVIKTTSLLSDEYHKSIRECVLKSELLNEKSYVKNIEKVFQKIYDLL